MFRDARSRSAILSADVAYFVTRRWAEEQAVIGPELDLSAQALPSYVLTGKRLSAILATLDENLWPDDLHPGDVPFLWLIASCARDRQKSSRAIERIEGKGCYLRAISRSGYPKVIAICVTVVASISHGFAFENEQES